MGEEKQQPPASSENSQDALVRLAEIEKAVAEISALRKKQFWVNLLSIVAVVIIILAFINNMVNYAKDFDNQMLMMELQNQAQEMAQSTEMQMFAKELQTAFVPAYKDALQATMTAKLPEIRKAALNVTENLENYLKKDVKNKLEQELAESMKKLEQELVKRYPNLTTEQIHEVFTHAQGHFMDEVIKHTEKRINGVLHELAVLRESFNQFKNDPEYKALKKDQLDEIKSRMVETVLELWIYNLNPSKGNLPAGGK